MSNFFSFLHKKGTFDWIIVGLGNPTPKYQHTRHNVGYLAIDTLAKLQNASIERQKFSAKIGECSIGKARCLLMKPTTFMNLSGQAVEQARAFYKLPNDRIIVLYDDISLPFGSLRIRRKGSAGGHNGIRSIIQETGTETFPRIKFGIGEPPTPQYDLAKWVLGKFTAKDLSNLVSTFATSNQAIEQITSGNIDQAMNLYNSR